MSSFTAPLRLEPLNVTYLDGRNWRVLEEFDFASETLERIVCVPAGFETDFASVPKILWNLLPPTGTYGKAAVLHDALYRTPSEVCTRELADRTFLEAMIALGTSWFVSTILYLGVRLGGRSSFHRRVYA